MFNNGQELLNAFNSGSAYFGPIILQDTAVGFSIKRHYPAGIAFKPSQKADGTVLDVATFWVVLREKENSKYTLTVRVATMNMAPNSFGQFDYDDPNSPTEQSIELRNKSPFPSELIETFHYAPDSGFSDNRGRPITPTQILDSLFKQHCDTIHWLRGSELRFKTFMRSIIGKVLWGNSRVFKFLLEKVFRQKLVADREMLEEYYGYKTVIPQEGQSIDFLGYKASRLTVLFTCLIVFLALILKGKSESLNAYYTEVTSNDVVATIHVVLLLTFFELLPSWLLLPILNISIKGRMKVLMSNINPFTYQIWLKPLLFAICCGGLGLLSYHYASSLSLYFHLFAEQLKDATGHLKEVAQ